MAQGTTGDNVISLAPYVWERQQEETRPYLQDTSVFFLEVFELGDAEANKTEAKRPFGLKELFASFIKLGFCFDPAIKRFGSGEHFVGIELVFQCDSSARPSSSFHVIFELGRNVLELLQDFFFLRSGLESSN